MNRVVNTTVICNFAAVEQLDLLRDIAGPLFLPIQVYDEIVAGQAAGYLYYEGIEQHIVPFTTDGWLHLVTMNEDELVLFASLPSLLHQGERACLSIARHRDWGFLTDDRSARRQAAAWNVLVSGTLGILVLAVQDGRLTVTSGNGLLKEMVERANYRSPTMDLSGLLL